MNEIVAGTAGGVGSIIVCHPLDTIRVRLQTAHINRFSGVFDCIRQTAVNEGALAFYKGLSAPLFSQAITKATMFFGHAWCRELMHGVGLTSSTSASSLPLPAIAVSGAFAGTLNTLVSCPIELIRCNLQIQYDRHKHEARFRGPIQCARAIVAQHGVLSLWRGGTAMILRDVPGLAAYFAAFEGVRRWLQSEKVYELSQMSTLMIAGSVGGICYWSTAFPQDVIKSVIQTRFASHTDTSQHSLPSQQQSQSQSQEARQNSPRDTFVVTWRRLIAEGGVKRLFRGFSVALLRGIPGASLTFTCYTYSMQFLQQHRL